MGSTAESAKHPSYFPMKCLSQHYSFVLMIFHFVRTTYLLVTKNLVAKKLFWKATASFEISFIHLGAFAELQRGR